MGQLLHVIDRATANDRSINSLDSAAASLSLSSDDTKDIAGLGAPLLVKWIRDRNMGAFDVNSAYSEGAIREPHRDVSGWS